MSLDINKIYIDEKSNNLTTFQSMVLKVTLDIMNLNDENYDEKVKHLLESIGKFFKADRAYLFFINHEEATMGYSQEWFNTGVSSLGSTNNKIHLENYPWWVDQLTNNKFIHVDDVRMMPDEANIEQQQLLKQSVKSILAIPLSDAGGIQAFIGIDLVKSKEKWTEENIEHLHILGQILSKGIVQLNNSRKLNFMSYHDPLTELPNRLSLTERLEQDILQTECQKPLISIMFINLDGFKVINDNFGYKQGNALLRQVSKRLVGIVGEKDIVSRTDSDQFILYISDYQNLEN